MDDMDGLDRLLLRMCFCIRVLIYLYDVDVQISSVEQIEGRMNSHFCITMVH